MAGLNALRAVVVRRKLARVLDALVISFATPWSHSFGVPRSQRSDETSIVATLQRAHGASWRCVSQLIRQAFDAPTSRIAAAPLTGDACRWIIAEKSDRSVRAHALAANFKPGVFDYCPCYCLQAAYLIPRTAHHIHSFSTALRKSVGPGQSGNLRHRCRPAAFVCRAFVCNAVHTRHSTIFAHAPNSKPHVQFESCNRPSL